MARLLVTGFEPFDARGYNTSREILPALPARIAGYELVSGVLPVSWERTATALGELVETFSPEVAVGLGMSQSPRIDLERIAVNFRTTERGDADGRYARGELIEEQGALALRSDLELEAVHAALTSAGHSARISGSAGDYVCNLAFYTLSAMRRAGRLRKVGFIHVPPLEAHGGWPLEKIARAVEIALSHAI